MKRKLPALLRALALPAAALALWEAFVRFSGAPAYVLPAPSLVFATLWSDRAILVPALLSTLGATLQALAAATLAGLSLAALFSRFPAIERALLPGAVILQVTPLIAIAPLLLVYLEPAAAVAVCAFLAAFFPILANTAFGLSRVDRNHLDLFRLYGASRWRILVSLRVPGALPYALSGLRIGGGLALVGAIAAELAAGAGGRGAGLAFRIVEAGYRLNVPRMFAALILVMAAGLALYGALSALSAAVMKKMRAAPPP